MASQRSNTRRYSARDRLFIGFVAAIACVLCYFNTTYSIAQWLAPRDAARAHALAPYDGRITGLYAAAVAGPDASLDDRAQADRLAREALRADPTAVSAVSTLGLNAQVRGQTSAARRIFTYSQTLSRRDLQTQLWAIEDAVGRGDVAGALRHYDIALRTTPAAQDLLFPVLAAAASQPKILAELVRTLARQPRWTADFIGYIAVHGPDPAATPHLFARLRNVGVPVPAVADAALVNALIARGYSEEAWSYYTSTHPGADRRRSRDPAFAETSVAVSPLDWMTVNDTGISTSIARNGQTGAFSYDVATGMGGTMLQQVQMLPAGVFRLTGHSSGIDQQERSRPYWVLRCRDGRELGRVDVPNSRQAGGSFAGTFNVPEGCAPQTLALVARAVDAIAGQNGMIDRVELRQRPAGG